MADPATPIARLKPAPSDRADQMAAKALKKIRALVKGNGVDPQKVTLNHYKIEDCTTDIDVQLHLQVDTFEKREPGRKSTIPIFGGPQDIADQIEKAKKQLLNNKDAHTHLCDCVMKSKHAGVGLESTVVDTPEIKSFGLHETCTPCKGQGKTTCTQCRGQGKQTCPACQGNRQLPCPTCRGTRQVFVAAAQSNQPCPKCHARGHVPCTQCRQHGHIPCKNCGATGQHTCKPCAGSGIQTLITNMQAKWVASSFINFNGVPATAAKLLQKADKQLVRGKHIITSLVNQVIKSRDDSGLHIPLELQFPHGTVRIQIENKSYGGEIFGYKAKLLNMPPFLETLSQSGQKHLNIAASGSGNIASQLRKAAEFRILADSILLAARFTPKKAAKALKQIYPHGLHLKSAYDWCCKADQSLRSISKFPRLVGLCIGLSLAIALYAAWYFGPIRDFAESHILNRYARLILDIVLVFVGGTITNICIQVSGAHSLQSTLTHIKKHATQSAIPKGPILAKGGKSALWGYLIGGCAYITIVFLTVVIKDVAPPWWLHSFL